MATLTSNSIWTETAKDVLSSLNLTLSPEWERVFFSESRIKLGTGGEGSGKSYTAAAYAVARSFYDQVNDGILYWIIGRDFEDARMEFGYIYDFLMTLGNVKEASMPNNTNSKWRLETLTGQVFETVSSYDYTKIGREQPDGIIGAEVSRWEEEAFKRCEGRLARSYHKGTGWGFFTGSFETSMGWLPDMWKYGQGPNERGIRSYSIPSWANTAIYPGGENDPAINILREGSTPERFMERYGGRPAPPKGIIFSEFRVISHVDHELEVDIDYPIYLAIDPGNLVYCVLFVQIIEGEIRILDEIYETGWTHEQVINACENNILWPLVHGGTIDIAAKQPHMGMPRPLEEWYKDAPQAALSAQKWSVDDTIDAVHKALLINPYTGRPRFRTHPKCKGIISEMGGGPSPLEEGGPWMRAKSVYGFGPPLTKNDHACKALGYLLQGPYGFMAQEYKNRSYEPVSYLSGGVNRPDGSHMGTVEERVALMHESLRNKESMVLDA